MPFIKVKINKFISKDFPGFIECSFLDAYNNEWKIIEKVPVISKQDIDENTVFPLEESLAVDVVKEWTDEKGRNLVTITTGNPLGVEATTKQTHFDLYKDQVIYSEEVD